MARKRIEVKRKRRKRIEITRPAKPIIWCRKRGNFKRSDTARGAIHVPLAVCMKWSGKLDDTESGAYNNCYGCTDWIEQLEGKGK